MKSTEVRINSEKYYDTMMDVPTTCNGLMNPIGRTCKSDDTRVEWNEWMDVSMRQETCNQEPNGWPRMNMDQEWNEV